MSLPESITYGGAVGAQAASGNAFAMNKANYGKYVSSVNTPDTTVQMMVQSAQRKDGTLDSWIRFEHFRNFAPISGGGLYVPAEVQNDRLLSVQIRTIGPLSTSNSDGRFTQAEQIDRTRSMASILYEAGFLERLFRGEL